MNLPNFYIRDFKSEDTPYLLKIFNPSLLSFPDLDSPLNIARLTVENDSGIIGFFFISITSEIRMILNPKLKKVDKALLIKSSEGLLYDKICQSGVNDTYVFTDDDKYKLFLEKHLKFYPTANFSLYRSLKNGR